MNGVELIAAEREQQIDSIGWDAEHDDDHSDGALWYAARCYLGLRLSNTRVPREWPWDTGDFKPKSRVENLVRAGALIAAEIDRLHRYTLSETPNDQ